MVVSETFGLAYIFTNSAKFSSSSEVTLTYNYQVTLSKEAKSKDTSKDIVWLQRILRGLSGLEKRKSRIEPDLSTKECAGECGHILLLDRKELVQRKKVLYKCTFLSFLSDNPKFLLRNTWMVPNNCICSSNTYQERLQKMK